MGYAVTEELMPQGLMTNPRLNNPARTFRYTIAGGAITANRQLNIPVIAGTDTLVTLATSQTFTGVKTFRNNTLYLSNAADTFIYQILGAALTADRALTLPLITGADTLAALGVAQTWTALQSFGTNLSGTLQTAAQANVTSLGTLTGLTLGVAGGLGSNPRLIVTSLDNVGTTDIAIIQALNQSLGIGIGYSAIRVRATAADAAFLIDAKGTGEITLASVSTGAVTIGAATVSTGKLGFIGLTSGRVTFTVAAIAGTWTMTLPATAGTIGYVLRTDGAGITSWIDPTAITLTTAAQPNVTSLGTLTGLTMGGTLTLAGNTITSATAAVIETTGISAHLTIRAAGATSNLSLSATNAIGFSVSAVNYLLLEAGYADVYAVSGLRLRGTNQNLGAFNATFIIDGATDSATTRNILIRTSNAAGTAPVTRLTFGSNAAIVALTWANAYHVGLKFGLATVATGAFTMDGATAGVATLTVPANFTNYTLTLPAAANTDAGFQLTCAAADTITSWAAAASRREWKNDLGLADKWDALQRLVSVPIHCFTFKEDAPSTGDYETVYRGPFSDEAPWAMHYKGNILNPISGYGDTVLAIQALFSDLQGALSGLQDALSEIVSLKAQVAALGG